MKKPELIDTVQRTHKVGTTEVSWEAKVYWDPEWEEYLVRLFKNGIEQVPASYSTTHKDDALTTARVMVN